MSHLARVYRESLALLTDLYELTMAYGYWKSGRAEQEAVFNLLFRSAPFDGGFTVAAGLGTAVEFLERLRFQPPDIAYLRRVAGADGAPLFEPEFLDYLSDLRLELDVDAVPEGTVVFPREPLVRVRGPIIHAQIVETALLTIVNFQSLIATKAARVCLAARGDSVLEFGLRRAQGIDGGLSASRAAFIGGCAATSNVLAGSVFDIPVSGTHAHSWVMSFDSEPEAFDAFARALPNNAVFLVDTYDTLEGVRHAVAAARRLREQGHEMIGIRLDSGDLAYLSGEARRILDEAGFPDAEIVASSELNEHIITSLKEQGATIGVWGVGTQLVTAYDQPALGGVYKLTAVRWPREAWQPRIKLSEQAVKITDPGVLAIRRYLDGGVCAGDMIYDEESPPTGAATIVHPVDITRRKHFPADANTEELLVPVFRAGRRVYDPPALTAIRSRVQEQLARFHPGIKRFVNPHEYPVGLEQGLHERRTELVLRARGETD